MRKPAIADQLTLSLFDSTSLGWGLTLDAPASNMSGPPLVRESFGAGDDTDEATAPAAPRVPAHTFRLTSDRALAQGWKARAADNLAAIRLVQQIEGEVRNATPEEQAKLALFTGFGATDLANGVKAIEDRMNRLEDDLKELKGAGWSGRYSLKRKQVGASSGRREARIRTGSSGRIASITATSASASAASYRS